MFVVPQDCSNVTLPSLLSATAGMPSIRLSHCGPELLIQSHIKIMIVRSITTLVAVTAPTLVATRLTNSHEEEVKVNSEQNPASHSVEWLRLSKLKY
jgi:hypothetical protein